MRAPIFLTVTGILLVMLVVFWWLLTIGFDESRYFRRCSLDYWLLVPDIIHHLPLDYCTGPALYHSSAGDGPKPSTVTRYCYTSDPTAAIAHYQALLLERGYQGPERQIYDREYLYFHQDDRWLRLVAMPPDRFEITYLE